MNFVKEAPKMENDEEIIRDDQLKNPNCHYSVSFSKSCYDKDGSFVCETMKNITRLCPNSRPVSIYTKRAKGDAQIGDDLNGGELPGFPFRGEPFGMFPDLNDVFRQQRERATGPIPRRSGEVPKAPDQDHYQDHDDYDSGFENLFRSFGFGSGRKPNGGGGGGGDSSRKGGNAGGGPQVPPGRVSGPSEDI